MTLERMMQEDMPIRMGRSTMLVYLAILEGCNRGKQPCLRELAAIIGVSSKNAVAAHLGKLAKLGLIEKPKGLDRAIKPLYRAELYVG